MAVELNISTLRDLSEISRGEGGGGWKQRKEGLMKKWAVKGGGSCKYVSLIM